MSEQYQPPKEQEEQEQGNPEQENTEQEEQGQESPDSPEAEAEASANFDELVNDDSDDLDEPETPASPKEVKEEGQEPGAEEPPKGEQQPKESPEKGSTPPAEAKPKEEAKPGEGPPEKPEEQPPAQQEPPQQQPLTAEQLREQFQGYVDQSIDLLAKEYYALSDDDLAELEDNPGEAFPKMAARVHMAAVTTAVGHVFQSLPAMLDVALQNRGVAEKAQSDFFERWPQLKGHEDDVRRFGEAYRQVNPSATIEDFIRDVGAQVVVAKKLPVEGMMGEQQQQQPAEQQTPAVPPHKPAASSPPGSRKPPPQNPFEALAEEDEMLDID